MKRERTVTELQGAAQEEGGSTPPLLAGLPGRCGGAGPAAQRRDVTVAAAVVGAGSAATKCELRRARAGGGVKSGSGGGEGRGRTAAAAAAAAAGAGGCTRVPRALRLAAGSSSVFLHRFTLSLLRSCAAGPDPLLSAEEPGGAGVPPPTWLVLPPLAPRSWARATLRNRSRGPRSALPPAARVECWGGGGVSAASRPGVDARPPCPRLGPEPPSRGPFPAQGPAAAAGRAPRGGRAGVFNGSMLPAAGAAPGQAGAPARPQPPRGHQLQLQLRALRLPQSPAALTGKRRRRRRWPTPGGFSVVSLLPPGFTSATPTPQSSPFTPDPPLPIVRGFLVWPLDSRAFSLTLGASAPRPTQAWTRVGSGSPADPSQARPPPCSAA